MYNQDHSFAIEESVLVPFRHAKVSRSLPRLDVMWVCTYGPSGSIAVATLFAARLPKHGWQLGRWVCTKNGKRALDERR